MRDYRKFCRPKVQINPKIGDIFVKLNCGEIVAVSSDDFEKVSNFFKIDSFVGSSNNKNVPGNIIANNTQFNVQDEFSSNSYNQLGDNFEIVEVVGAKETPLKGDIITYNNIASIEAIFDYNTFTQLSSEWDATGLYEINTYNFDDEVTEERYVIKAGDTTFIIQSSDYSYLNNTIWEVIDTISVPNLYEYVDLGLPSGTKWATMNVGASSETDYGNYYQYGKGAAQYSATSGDNNYSGTENPLDFSVDTAAQVWGGSWHMPTRAQMEELTANTTYQWVTNYKGSGINGGTFTATNEAVLFFPAAGDWNSGSQYDVGVSGIYWGSSPSSSDGAYGLSVINGGNGVYDYFREYGYSVRPVLDE